MKNGYFSAAALSIRSFIRKTQIDTENKFLLEINSDGILTLCGIDDISGYNDGYILAYSQNKICEITGNSLLLEQYGESKIIVSGNIECIKFIDR